MKLLPEQDSASSSAKISESFKTLATVAQELNARSNELGELVSSINESISALNLGVEAWVPIEGGWTGNDATYERHFLGYTKMAREWGLCLRVSVGHEAVPDQDVSETWFFNDAPRAMRARAVEKLADLLDRLTKKADSTSKKIELAAAQARQFQSALKRTTTELPKRTK